MKSIFYFSLAIFAGVVYGLYKGRKSSISIDEASIVAVPAHNDSEADGFSCIDLGDCTVFTSGRTTVVAKRKTEN